MNPFVVYYRLNNQLHKLYVIAKVRQDAIDFVNRSIPGATHYMVSIPGSFEQGFKEFEENLVYVDFKKKIA